mgnify:CR=1 FL=1
MKVTVKKPDILDVLSKVQGLAGRRTNLAITTNVLIRAQGSEIVLTATDLETGFEGAYPAQVAREVFHEKYLLAMELGFAREVGHE